MNYDGTISLYLKGENSTIQPFDDILYDGGLNLQIKSSEFMNLE